MSTTKEFRDYIYESLSRFGNIDMRKMMGEYLLYFNGILIGNICDNCLYLKQTPTSVSLLGRFEKGYPYEGSKTLMFVIDDAESIEITAELLENMAEELSFS